MGSCGMSVVVAEVSRLGATSLLARCSIAGVVTSSNSVGRGTRGWERHLLEGSVENGMGEVTASGVSSLAPFVAVRVTSFALDSRGDCETVTMPHVAQMKARNHTPILFTDCRLALNWAGLYTRTQRQTGTRQNHASSRGPRQTTRAGARMSIRVVKQQLHLC